MDRREALKLVGAAVVVSAGGLLLEDKVIAKGIAPASQQDLMAWADGVPEVDQATAEAIKSGRLKPKMETIDDVVAWFKHCDGWHIYSMDFHSADSTPRIGWAFFKKPDDSFGWNPTICPLALMKSADAKGKEFGKKVRECLNTDEGRSALVEFLKEEGKKS